MTLPMPAEWAPHAAVWIGFPHLDDEWAGQIDAARADVAAFANVVHDGGRGEEVRLVVNDERQAQIAATLVYPAVRILVQPLGDIWLRDTGPIIVGTGLKRRARNFRFNWWGEKFVMPGDQEVGAALATESGLPVDEQDWVLEGGGIDVDGTGDHTDGHVDNLARFVGEGRLALPVAAGSDDPNADIYEDARVRAAAFGGIEIVDLPSPGRIEMDGEIVAASYMNFYIGNTVVVVPTYGVANDAAAVEALAALFPDRRSVGVPARGIIVGGGSFHCSSQQVPA